MSYLDNLLKMQYAGSMNADLGLAPGDAFASYYNPVETSSPQYNIPNTFFTEQTGYLHNEFVYSIIIKRATAEAEGRIRVNRKVKNTEKNADDLTEPIIDHELTDLIHHPNDMMTEDDFWGIKRIFMDLAGFSAFEIEYNKAGRPMRLWPMLPHWCSFLRGQQQPLRAIRYQPYGLPYQDIPIIDPDIKRRRVLVFSNAEDYHPLYPNIRYYSPAMHAMPLIEVDNAMTFFLNDFVKHGAKFAGLLSVQQSINDTVAEDYRRRWVQVHGGVNNWSAPLILGLGTQYQNMQMNFKDMAFEALDGRTESRICNTFQIPVIVADARVGQQVSSYNNKKQATTDWYHDWVVNAWDKNSETMTQQMVPLYGDDPHQVYCDIDYSRVYAMQEDQDMVWKRYHEAWTARGITLNEYRDGIGKPPEKNKQLGASYYIQVAIRNQEAISPQGEITQAAAAAQEGQDEQKADNSQQQPPNKKTPAEQANEEKAIRLEVKNFRAFAKKRVKEGKRGDIPEYEFKVVPIEQQAALMAEFGVDIKPLAILKGIELAVKAMEHA